MTTTKPNIAQWIAHAIVETGCTVVYGGHGGALVPLVNAVCEHPQLTWVCARNEHDAATMAAAHAKMTGELGVVIATSGPGATNLVTGLMEAALDRVALLAVTGLKPTAQLGYAEFQDVNQSRLFAGAGIEWSKDAASAHAVIPLLRDAVSTALAHRTCAHLAIPVDIQAAQSPIPLKTFCASHADLRLRPRALEESQLDETAQLLVGNLGEPRPRNIIAVGLRGVHANMESELIDLAEALNAPILTRLHAKGVVDETHPLSFGVIGVHGKPGLEAAATLISTCDRTLSIGVDDLTLLVCNLAGLQIRNVIEMEPDAMGLSTRFEAEKTLVGGLKEMCAALSQKVEVLQVKRQRKAEIASVHVKTNSKSPEEILDALEHLAQHDNPRSSFAQFPASNPKTLKRQLSSTVSQVVDAMGGQDQIMKKADQLWHAIHEGEWRKLVTTRHQCEYASSEGYCHPAAVLDALSRLRRSETTDTVSRNAAITVDVGDVTLWASLCLHLTGGSRTLYSERLGTMGYALNAGVAAILATPGPSGAVVLVGDGGFQMSLQELSAFQQYKRPGDKLLVIVLDNSVLGRVVFGFDDAKGCEMTGPDYVKLAEAYGGQGVLLNSNQDAPEVMKKALSTDGLCLVHVLVDPEVKADMATFKDGSLKVMNSG